MYYLVDTNILTGISADSLSFFQGRVDLFVIDGVVDEMRGAEERLRLAKEYGLSVVKLTHRHLETMKEILAVDGDNLKLINLYFNQGAADIPMLSYAYFEKNNRDKLIPEDWSIITEDGALIEAANRWGISCVRMSEFKKLISR
jgi:rRNA-processing protein FCF1